MEKSLVLKLFGYSKFRTWLDHGHFVIADLMTGHCMVRMPCTRSLLRQSHAAVKVLASKLLIGCIICNWYQWNIIWIRARHIF
ncbi:hypothetical protein M758_6G036000 [Ceratodon purpureus]|nr:hypothetical protein M758_6G036000 [Ceratodon purpureus]